jgi:tetratricopeptide (TPR) repeat protein
MTRKILILLLGLLVFSREGFTSQAAASLYNQGNRFYSQNQFDKAIDLYRQAEKSGVTNSNLYYNLGNACYKAGDPGRAVLYWLRAERLSPNDPDLKANLKLVSAQVSKALPVSSSNPITEFFRALRDLGPSRGWGMLLSVSIWGFWAALSLRIIFGRSRIKTGLSILLATFIILVLVSGSGFLTRRHWEQEPAAVVIAKDLLAKSGPGAGFTGVFNIPAGARILVKECRSGFCSIELPPGMVGWVDEKSIEKI